MEPGGNPVWLVILRMLREQRSEESLAILRADLERNPLNDPVRMFYGELLRMQGDSEPRFTPSNACCRKVRAILRLLRAFNPCSCRSKIARTSSR